MVTTTEGAAPTTTAPMEITEQQQQQPTPSVSPMKNPINPAVVLESLRSKIPAHLLAEYSTPLEVSPEDVVAAQHRSTMYHAELARQKTIVKAKPDIKAVKHLQSAYPDWPNWARQYGHPPGIKPGDSFSGRGELWLVGAHQQYFRGIDSAGKAPAYAIVLSGEYEDDDDHGDYLHYTGEGGRGADGWVRQVKDQNFESSGNAALQRNCEQGGPVRVMRGAKSPEGEISYTYDGLYCVTSAELVPGRSGMLVCKFAMVGIPGHYKACRKVTFLAVRGFKSIQLAGREYVPLKKKATRPRGQIKAKDTAVSAAASAPKRQRTSGSQSGKRNSDGILILPEPGPANKEEYLEELRARKGLLVEDLTSGVESWPIPVFNETNDGAVLPSDLHYIKESQIFDSKGAESIVEAALHVMPGGGRWCGIKQAAQHPKYLWRSYNDEGLLLATNAFGVWECCADGGTCSCSASTSNQNNQCVGNKVVTRGLDLPLEIFRTIGRGWGVRCMQTIYPGQIIATYEGELLTNAEAELRRDNQSYLFDLDHFLIIKSDPTTSVEEQAALPPVPDCCTITNTTTITAPTHLVIDNEDHVTDAERLLDFMESPDAPHLVLDARTRGNVGRFFNHSCSPNIMVQPVLTQNCSALRYRVAFVGLQTVEPGIELCYNYGQRYFFKEGGQVVPCACGSENCQGVLG